MSIDFFAVCERDQRYIDALERGSDVSLRSINVSLVVSFILSEVPGFVHFRRNFVEIARFEGVSEAEARQRYPSEELNWNLDGNIQVNVDPRGVSVFQGYGGGDRQLEAMSGLFDALEEQGLYIFDAQEGDWWRPARD